MHLITATLISLIAKKAAPGLKKDYVASFRGIVEHVHGIPGRHRFRVPSLHHNVTGRERLRSQLPVLPGVDSVECDPRSGSLVISGSESMDGGLVLAAIVRLLNLEAQVEKIPSSRFSSSLTGFWHLLERMCYEQSGGWISASDAVKIVLIVASIMQIRKNRSLGIPSAFTMIWWFFTMLQRDGKRQ